MILGSIGGHEGEGCRESGMQPRVKRSGEAGMDPCSLSVVIEPSISRRISDVNRPMSNDPSSPWIQSHRADDRDNSDPRSPRLPLGTAVTPPVLHIPARWGRPFSYHSVRASLIGGDDVDLENFPRPSASGSRWSQHWYTLHSSLSGEMGRDPDA